MAYNGTVDLISGIRQKNNGNFPLVDASAVRVTDSKRLDAKLNEMDTAMTPDTTLAVSGKAADAKKTGDELSDLKSAIDKYDNPFDETIPEYTNGIIGVQILDKNSANYESYRIRAIQKNSTYHWYMTLQGYDGENWNNIDNVLSAYDAEATYPRVETLISNYGKYSVTLDWDYIRDSDIANSSITGIILKNSIVYKPFTDALNDIATLKTNEQMYDSIFAVPVPESMNGIVDFNVTNPSWSNYEKYRFSIVRHNSSYHIYIQVQGYDGSTWTNIDSFSVSASSAPSPLPAVEIIKSYYKRMTVTIVWGRMGTLALTNQNFVLKDRVVNRTQISLQTQITAVSAKAQLPSYELADNIKHVVTVKKDGTGDYTTIGAAYAAITDSAFDNQYEIIVYPGTYNENDLKPPAYTHTHGIYPMQTIVDSTGLYDEEDPDLSVFDQGHAPSKLSNMVIKSQTKYCVHQDVELRGVTLVNENLYCIRLTGGSDEKSVIGIGADFDGAKFVYRNCTFVNGAVASHTNPNNLPNGNQHIIYDSCVFANSYVALLVAGLGDNVSGNTFGEYVCEIKNCKFNAGINGLQISFGRPITGITLNQPWQVIGCNNNFAPKFINANDTSATDDWDAICTSDKVSIIAAENITKGKFITITGEVADNSTPADMVLGIAVAGGSTGDYIPVWKSAYAYTGTDGLYGISASGELDSSATIKTGRIYNNIYYPLA